MDQVLDYDIKTIAEPALDKLLPNWRLNRSGLNQVRREVLLNMAFNMGLTVFKGFPKFWAAVKVKDWELAAVEMMDSLWAAQVGRRANELKDAMKSGKFS